ncbi:MAG: hypothetical protein KF726_21860 [Anaerolineae bacterium]|nr:hypothetical protein [Anaerolineae bacterium]
MMASFRIARLLTCLILISVFIPIVRVAANHEGSIQANVRSQISNFPVVDMDWNAQNQLAVGYVDGLVQILDMNGNVLASRDLSSEQYASLRSLAWNPTPNATVIAVSFLIDTYSIIRLWNTATNQVQEITPKDKVGQLDWSPDGTKLAGISFSGVGSADYKYIGVWNMPSGTPYGGTDESSAIIVALEWHPTNNDLIAFGDENGVVTVWNVETNSTVAEFQGQDNVIWDLAWSPDGSELMTTGGDVAIYFWETNSYTRIRSLVVDSPLLEVMWNPANPEMIAVVDGSSLQVLDTHTGEVLLTYKSNSDPHINVAWCIDGSQLAVSDTSDSIIQLIDLNPNTTPTIVSP